VVCLDKNKIKIVAQNKKAYHDYFVLETFEAGIELFGTEIKSVRESRVNLKDSWCSFDDGQIYARGVHISPYDKGNIFNREPMRPKRLLLHKREILHLFEESRQQGLTVIPLKMYIKGSYAKLEIGVCKGKKNYDKRADIAEKDAKRNIERAMKEKYKA